MRVEVVVLGSPSCVRVEVVVLGFPSCVRVEVVVLGSPSLTVSVGVKQHLKKKKKKTQAGLKTRNICKYFNCRLRLLVVLYISVPQGASMCRFALYQ